MNEFREKLFGAKPDSSPLLRAKPARPAPPEASEGEEGTTEFAIPRETVRQSDHRDGDRHRLEAETATLVAHGQVQPVTLINLSGGGAMIEGAEGLRLWDRVELRLGGSNSVEAAVRWIRGNRFGLEFAHETRIELDTESLADTLREVLARSFPDVALEQADAAEADGPASSATDTGSTDAPDPEAPRDPAERELRHPLIWSGLVHYAHESTPVRLRNISANGALIEGAVGLPVGAELLLDLDEAGALFASVHWSRGDSAGLQFHAPFDLRKLAAVRPDVAGSRWVAPDYLRDDRSANSPWASQWGRSDLAGLHRSLGPRS